VFRPKNGNTNSIFMAADLRILGETDDVALEMPLDAPPAGSPPELLFIGDGPPLLFIADDDGAAPDAALDATTSAEAVPEMAIPAYIDAKDQPLAAHVEPTIPWPKSLPMRVWYGLCWGLEWLFGLASVIGTLAVLAAIPIVNFVSLGYLLETSGRVARSGRLRDGFIDMPKFARIGSLVAGTWLWLLLPRLMSSYAADAWLIDPGSVAARGWRIGQFVVTAVVIGHILLAWYSGGRLRHFFWPLLAPFQLGAKVLFGGILGPILRPTITSLSPKLAEDLYVARPLSMWFPPAILWAGLRRGHLYVEARDAVWDFVVSLRLPHYFWLGLRGFAGAIAWLIVPTVMMMAGTSGGGPGTILIGYLGTLGLAVVLLYLPFLQTHFAAENRLAAMFELRTIRQQFRRAPLAWWLALTVTLALALPLYPLKIEYLQRELMWTLTLFFIVFIYPARLLTGWAVGRARQHTRPRHFVWRWLARVLAIPVVLFYLLILFFTQYTSFLGPASLLEQHAFLLPVPFVGM
jgi:hypothetical protein